MYDDIIELCSIERDYDEHLNPLDVLVKREVFAELKSISQTEFYAAAQAGFKPELKFVLSDYYDYDNETQLVYKDVLYDIIRTYRQRTELEIVCQRCGNG